PTLYISLLSIITYSVISMALSLPISTLFPYTTLFRSSTSNLTKNLNRMIDVFNAHSTKLVGIEKSKIADLIDLNPKNIKWTTDRSEEHTSELQSRENLVCRLLLEKKKYKMKIYAREE